MMGNSMMNNGMTGSSMMNPELSSFMNQQIQEHQQFLQQRMSPNWNDSDFQEQWQQRLQKHQNLLQNLLENQQIS